MPDKPSVKHGQSAENKASQTSDDWFKPFKSRLEANPWIGLLCFLVLILKGIEDIKPIVGETITGTNSYLSHLGLEIDFHHLFWVLPQRLALWLGLSVELFAAILTLAAFGPLLIKWSVYLLTLGRISKIKLEFPKDSTKRLNKFFVSTGVLLCLVLTLIPATAKPTSNSNISFLRNTETFGFVLIIAMMLTYIDILFPSIRRSISLFVSDLFALLKAFALANSWRNVFDVLLPCSVLYVLLIAFLEIKGPIFLSSIHNFIAAVLLGLTVAVVVECLVEKHLFKKLQISGHSQWASALTVTLLTISSLAGFLFIRLDRVSPLPPMTTVTYQLQLAIDRYLEPGSQKYDVSLPTANLDIIDQQLPWRARLGKPNYTETTLALQQRSKEFSKDFKLAEWQLEAAIATEQRLPGHFQQIDLPKDLHRSEPAFYSQEFQSSCDYPVAASHAKDMCANNAIKGSISWPVKIDPNVHVVFDQFTSDVASIFGIDVVKSELQAAKVDHKAFIGIASGSIQLSSGQAVLTTGPLLLVQAEGETRMMAILEEVGKIYDEDLLRYGNDKFLTFAICPAAEGARVEDGISAFVHGHVVASQKSK